MKLSSSGVSYRRTQGSRSEDALRNSRASVASHKAEDPCLHKAGIPATTMQCRSNLHVNMESEVLSIKRFTVYAMDIP